MKACAPSSRYIDAWVWYTTRSSNHGERDDPGGRFKIGGDGMLHQFRVDAPAPRQHAVQDDIKRGPHHFVRDSDLGPGGESIHPTSGGYRAADNARQEAPNP